MFDATGRLWLVSWVHYVGRHGFGMVTIMGALCLKPWVHYLKSWYVMVGVMCTLSLKTGVRYGYHHSNVVVNDIGTLWFCSISTVITVEVMVRYS